MKKINLLLALAAFGLTFQTAIAQTTDTSKNKVEIKKKVKVGVNGRQVTKIKMESKGTPGTVTGAVDGAISTKPKVITTPAPTVNPTVVVVQPEPAVKTTASTTAAVSTPVTTTRTTTTTATSRHVSSSKVVPRKRTVTTTTTVKKQ